MCENYKMQNLTPQVAKTTLATINTITRYEADEKKFKKKKNNNKNGNILNKNQKQQQ